MKAEVKVRASVRTTFICPTCKKFIDLDIVISKEVIRDENVQVGRRYNVTTTIIYSLNLWHHHRNSSPAYVIRINTI